MKIKLLSIATLCALMSVGASLPAQAQTPVPGVRVGGQHRERHPELMKAMRALQRARADLASANRDFGGHRTLAVQAIDNAISQIREAIEFDKH